MATKKQISQPPAKSPPTARTQEKPVRSVPPAKPAPRPVRANFKAGKDL